MREKSFIFQSSRRLRSVGCALAFNILWERELYKYLSIYRRMSRRVQSLRGCITYGPRRWLIDWVATASSKGVVLFSKSVAASDVRSLLFTYILVCAAGSAIYFLCRVYEKRGEKKANVYLPALRWVKLWKSKWSTDKNDDFHLSYWAVKSLCTKADIRG